MKHPFVGKVGGVLSCDIAVPDHERELAFYSSILTTGETPLWRGDLMNNQGTPVIGLGLRTAEYSELPLQWTPHFQVADVAASVKAAVNGGGQAIMRSEHDEWAVLSDAAGAAFGVIPVADGPATSAEVAQHGHIAWLALHVFDPPSSRDYYQQVVGWESSPIPDRDNETDVRGFEMLIDEESSAGEILQTREPQAEQDDIPAVWLIHLPVADLTESLRRVNEHGGKVIHNCTETGRAIVRDPVGVYLALQRG